MLPHLRALFSLDNPKGPRSRVVKQQNKLFTTVTITTPMLSDLRFEVKAESFGGRPMTIPGATLQHILMLLAGRLFIQKDGEDKRILLDDMFRDVAILRVVNSSFYIAVVDIWPGLQEEFVKSVAAFIKTDPVGTLSVAKIMKVLDPSLSRQHDTLPSDDDGSDEGGDEGGDEDERAVPPLRRPRRKRGESDDEKEDQNDADYDAAAKALCFTFHERLKRHLRYHSAIQLMILFYNEKKVTKTLDKTVPTLSGFAAYLNTFFGFLIKQSIITNDSRNKTISLFYESEWAPAWNMLPDEQGTKNLQEYLDSYHFTSIPNGKLSKLMPAPAHLFPGEWPLLPEVGSLDTYIFAGQEVSMPPIRMVTMEFECVELVAEIILPIRLLLDSSCYDLESNRTIWIPQYNAYTMQVTWDMLAQCSWKDEMPPDFEIIDHRGAALNAERSLPDGSPLTPHLLAVWADVLLTYSAHHGENCFRKRVDDLPLFRYSVLVVNRIKDILPSFLHCNIYIDGDENAGDFRYRNSPIQRDWGETRWEEDEPDVWELKLDPEFQELDQCQPPSRKSWATSGFFDMSLFFMKRIIGLRNTPIWNERLYDEDISWLMKQAALWSRHTFAAAKMVVKKQHNLLTTSNPGATGIQVNLPVVTQARPRGQLTSINRKRRW